MSDSTATSDRTTLRNVATLAVVVLPPASNWLLPFTENEPVCVTQAPLSGEPAASVNSSTNARATLARNGTKSTELAASWMTASPVPPGLEALVGPVAEPQKLFSALTVPG